MRAAVQGSSVVLPKMVRKEAHALTLAQAKALLGALQYPERELALTAMLTHMNVVEICGLQWKWVNLAGDWGTAEGERLLDDSSPEALLSRPTGKFANKEPEEICVKYPNPFSNT